MKRIDISSKTYPNKTVLVDDEDYDAVVKYKWRPSKQRRTFYAARSYIENGKYRLVLMHRQILGQRKGIFTDHRDGDGLNNTRGNIRECTSSQNSMNRIRLPQNKSGYRGVSWGTRNKRWIAGITKNRKYIYLGSFTCPITAARAYDDAAKEHFGEFAILNFPE
jgi:hypothetical protein